MCIPVHTGASAHSRSSVTAHVIPMSCRFVQYQTRVRRLYLQKMNGMEVHCPKDQNRLLNRLMLYTESRFPGAFQALKKVGVKLVTR
jgi:phytanoyl-CoA hydroxylase